MFVYITFYTTWKSILRVWPTLDISLYTSSGCCRQFKKKSEKKYSFLVQFGFIWQNIFGNMKYFRKISLQTWRFISSNIILWYQIFIYVFINTIAQEGYHRFLYDVCMQCSVINHFYQYKLLLTAIYYFQRLYTNFHGYILHSTAVYYFWGLYTTFSFTLL